MVGTNYHIWLTNYHGWLINYHGWLTKYHGELTNSIAMEATYHIRGSPLPGALVEHTLETSA